MTEKERQRCYDNWQKYKWHAEEKQKEIHEYLEHFKPRKHGTQCSQ